MKGIPKSSILFGGAGAVFGIALIVETISLLFLDDYLKLGMEAILITGILENFCLGASFALEGRKMAILFLILLVAIIAVLGVTAL